MYCTHVESYCTAIKIFFFNSEYNIEFVIVEYGVCHCGGRISARTPQ